MHTRHRRPQAILSFITGRGGLTHWPAYDDQQSYLKIGTRLSVKRAAEQLKIEESSVYVARCRIMKRIAELIQTRHGDWDHSGRQGGQGESRTPDGISLQA